MAAEKDPPCGSTCPACIQKSMLSCCAALMLAGALHCWGFLVLAGWLQLSPLMMQSDQPICCLLQLHLASGGCQMALHTTIAQHTAGSTCEQSISTCMHSPDTCRTLCASALCPLHDSPNSGQRNQPALFGCYRELCIRSSPEGSACFGSTFMAQKLTGPTCSTTSSQAPRRALPTAAAPLLQAR